jgi:hypothetical protein
VERKEGQRLKRSSYMVSTNTIWALDVGPPSIMLQVPDQNENFGTRTQYFSARISYILREAALFSLAIDLRADVAICAREVAAGKQHTIPNAARVHTSVGICSQELRSGGVETAFVIIAESI